MTSTFPASRHLPAEAELRPQRWILLEDLEDSTERLAEAVISADSALVKLRYAHALVSVVSLRDLATAVCEASKAGFHCLRIHGMTDGEWIRMALRSNLNPGEADRIQYVRSPGDALRTLLSEMRHPDTAVLIGWWQSRGERVPTLGWPSATPGFADAAAAAFDQWVIGSGILDHLKSAVDLWDDDELAGQDLDSEAVWRQPGDMSTDFDSRRQSDLLSQADRPARLPVRATTDRALAASGREWTLVLNVQLPTGKTPLAAATADSVEVFEPSGASPWSEALEIRFAVTLHVERWQGRPGLRLEIHLPHRLAIVVALDSGESRTVRTCRLSRDRLPVDPDGWKYARFRLRAAARSTQK